MKHIPWFLIAAIFVCASPALASQPSANTQSVGVCDWATATNCVKPDSNGVTPVKQVDSGNTDATDTTLHAVKTVDASETPTGAAQITAASGNVANAGAVATLAGTTGKTTYITGFQCTAAGATAASVVSATVAGVVTGTMTYTFVAPAGATAQATPLIVSFGKPVAASATNTAIVVTLPALGSGNTNATCNAQGYQR
jgi:hypothetical protein